MGCFHLTVQVSDNQISAMKIVMYIFGVVPGG